MMKKNILIFLVFLIIILVLKSYLSSGSKTNEVTPTAAPPSETTIEKANEAGSETEVKAPGAKMESSQPDAPETENEPVTPYQTELKSIQEKLPTMDDLSKLSEEEVHHTPEIILEGARLLGNVVETAINDTTKRKDTLKFFFDCSEDEDIALSTRALCWNKGTRYISEWNIFIPISNYKVPDKVKILAEKIN